MDGWMFGRQGPKSNGQVSNNAPLKSCSHRAPPRRTIIGLETHPDIKVEIFIYHRLDIKSDSRYCRYDFTDLEPQDQSSQLYYPLL